MAHDFDSLSDAVRDLGMRGAGLIPFETPVYAPPGRPSLQDLPDSLLIASDLDEARTNFAVVIAGGAGRRARMEAQRRLDMHERRYSDAVRRDAIKATRPSDCWCLGAGGRDVRYLPMPTDRTIIRHDGTEGMLIDEAETFKQHCGCPEGTTRAKADRETVARYWRWRDRQAVERRFGIAKLPKEYRAYDWRQHPDTAVVARIQAWLDEPKDKPESAHWLLLYGPGGRGKTTLLHGLAADRLNAGYSALFRTTLDLIDDIRATFGKPEEQAELLALLRRVEHLYLDDLGVEVPRDWIGETIYSLLNHRHNEQMPTYFSSNLEPQDLGAHLGERIYGRLKRMVEPIAMLGDDLRDRHLRTRMHARKGTAR